MIMALLCLCLSQIIMKILLKKQAQAETPRPRFSRHSTILDYINVVPKAGPPAQDRNEKATSSSPSRTPPPPGAPCPESKKNQKKPYQLFSCPEPKSSIQAPEAQKSQEELHYATLNFPGLRPRPEARMPKGTQADYNKCRQKPQQKRLRKAQKGACQPEGESEAGGVRGGVRGFKSDASSRANQSRG
nr:sialic acid-binding Ig-like lectin 10 [Aotus nancymaae]